MDYFLLLFRQIQIDSFEYPWVLALLCLPVVYFVLAYVLHLRLSPRITIPRLQTACDKETPKPRFFYRVNAKRLIRSGRFLAFCSSVLFFIIGFVLITIALAHPYGGSVNENRTEGIDIYFSLDMSASMRAYDYSVDDVEASYFLDTPKPNRFEVAKTTIYDFVQSRKERCSERTHAIARCDRIGIVLFGQIAFVDVPLTNDYGALSSHIVKRRIDDIDATQSAIGEGIMSAVASLRHTDSKSKNIILVSDGDRKGGRISMNQAIAAAKKYGVRIFPILIGSGNTAVLAVHNYDGGVTFREAQFPINYELLEEIANQTGGKAYRASTDTDFQNMLSDVLEKLEPDVSVDMRGDNQIDLSIHFVLLAFLSLLLSFIIYHLACRRYP
ncbi:MAG: VWA domain-containing protein [Proteobacteria bacterium]|nr:VWA domain-containing protein [Pseudomonadota bacterium]